MKKPSTTITKVKITGIGKPKGLAPPNQVKLFGKLKTGIADVMIKVIPRNIEVEDKVTINGLTFNFPTNNPFTLPNMVPNNNPSVIAKGTGIFPFIAKAIIIPARDAIAPTDKSIPPLQIT